MKQINIRLEIALIAAIELAAQAKNTTVTNWCNGVLWDSIEGLRTGRKQMFPVSKLPYGVKQGIKYSINLDECLEDEIRMENAFEKITLTDFLRRELWLAAIDTIL